MTGVYDFDVASSDGTPMSLSAFRGTVVLIANTASRCGFTPQYASLQALHDRYRARGFSVLAFPANNFMRQEPGTNEEIQAFCRSRYHTTFPIFAKISVRGKEIHPLYAHLTRATDFRGAVVWNFTKFLVGRDGRVAARFGPATDPMSTEVVEAIEALLAAPST